LNEIESLENHGFAIPLVVWRQRGQFCMLLPLAENNLKAYLQSTPQPRRSKRTIKAIIKQIMGLVEALNHMHLTRDLRAPTAEEYLPIDVTQDTSQMTGYHHDLRPENVLVFPDADVGIWKIADFGTARLYAQQCGHNRLFRRQAERDTDYRAPDYELSNDRRHAALYDVWSFGCILLEIMIWLFDIGEDSVQQFRLERLLDDIQGRHASFWMTTNTGVQHRPSVLRRIHSLLERTAAFAPFHHLIYLTKTCLELDRTQRPQAFRVLQTLKIIHREIELKLNTDPEFYIEERRDQNPVADFSTKEMSEWDTVSQGATSTQRTAQWIKSLGSEAPSSNNPPPSRSHTPDSGQAVFSVKPESNGALKQPQEGMEANDIR
jgi:serine/threonine protein kinase